MLASNSSFSKKWFAAPMNVFVLKIIFNFLNRACQWSSCSPLKWSITSIVTCKTFSRNIRNPQKVATATFLVSLATFRQHRVHSVELEEMFRNGSIPDTFWTYFRVPGLNLSPCRDIRSLSGATDPNFARSVRSIRRIFVAEKCPEWPKATKKW